MHEPTTGIEERQIKATSQSSIPYQLRRLLALHGIAGLSRMVMAKAIGLVLWMTPSRRRARAAVIEKDREFDRQWGVNTSGRLVPDASEIVGKHWVYGTRYEGVDADDLEWLLGDLGIDHKEFTFIDFGSGKGRAILVASRFPFRKVIGVEYSEPLTKIAQENISIFRKHHTICDIEAVWADALDFPIPTGPLVVFLANPFGQVVMDALIERISASMNQSPQPILVLYFRPFLADSWRAVPFVKEVRTTQLYSVFESTDGVLTSAPRLRRCG